MLNVCKLILYMVREFNETFVFKNLTHKMAHNKDNTCLSKERLTTLIREIFRKEFEKQQKNLLNLISGNLEITMKEIKSIKVDVPEKKFKSAGRKLNILMISFDFEFLNILMNEFGKYMNDSWILNMSITN